MAHPLTTAEISARIGTSPTLIGFEGADTALIETVEELKAARRAYNDIAPSIAGELETRIQ